MSLKVRVIPVLLSRGGLLVKGRGFSGGRVIGQVRQAARVHERRSVDELVILDITATREDRGPDLGLIESVAGLCPLAVGGGVRSVDDARRLLLSGADKIVVGTAQHDDGLVSALASKFGSQAVVASIDVKKGDVMTHSGTVGTGKDPVAWAREVAVRGAGEIMLCSVERDGTMSGYDLGLVRGVAKAVKVPVIASGGCSGADDMAEAICSGAHAVAAGALFQFTQETPASVAARLADLGVAARTGP